MRILKKALPFWSAFFIACLIASPALYAACVKLPHAQSVVVSSVYDGDTVSLQDGRRVRIIGINAPELGRDGSADEYLARNARDYLRSYISGKTVALVLGKQSKDRYGRWLGHLYLGDELIAEKLLLQGLAFRIAVPPNIKLLTCLVEAEEQAIKDRKGLWQQSPYLPVSHLQTGVSGFQLLSGHITKLSRVSSGWVMELDQRVAVLLDDQMVADLNMAQLKKLGRLVLVRGWLRPKSSSAPAHFMPWSLRVRHASDLEY